MGGMASEDSAFLEDLSDPIGTVTAVQLGGHRDQNPVRSQSQASDRRGTGYMLELAEQCGIELAPHPRVSIHPDAVVDLARILVSAAESEGREPYAWDDPKFWPVEDDAATRSQLLAVGNAMNFRFWRRSSDGIITPMSGALQGEVLTGSMYLWRKLRLALNEGVPLSDAQYLGSMDPDTFEALFSDDKGFNPLGEGVEDRVANLRDLGQQLTCHWGGEFSNVVAASHQSLPAYMQFSRRFRAFDDSVGKLALVNALMLRGSGLASFHQPLLPAIDYQLLKQLLRQGVIVPEVALSNKLRRLQYLNDNEALQLRSAALEALLLCCEASGLPGDVVDNRLWRNRTICIDVEPACVSCIFNTFCVKDASFQRPLHLTRHY